MNEASDAVRGPTALILTEDTIRRDHSGVATAIGIRVGDSCEANLELTLDPSDPFEELVRDALERDLDAPHLHSARYRWAVDALVRRGLALGSAVTRASPAHMDAFNQIADAIHVVGSADLFDQAWEALLFSEDALPFSLGKPVIRVVPGAVPYLPRYQQAGSLKVAVINARLKWSTDIPPRHVTRPLYDLASGGNKLAIGVIAPAFPNEVEGGIVPVPGVHDPHPNAAVLHVDAHGVLLSHRQLTGRYGTARAAFVRGSWGLEVEPYSGLKAFILINGLSADGKLAELPISGEELGALCRQAGTPLVVLNACQAASSAAEGGIAVDLIKAGVPDVIAFLHQVTADSAAVFVTALYRELARGASTAQACCSARAALYRRGITTAANDALLFPDWISLVHYSSSAVEPVSLPSATVDHKVEPFRPALPVPLEWALVDVQYGLYQMRCS
ncbi:MAG TPA: CHAT domain-containing protein, partial [Albitalea sp.]|nr:CHAT domain-containing protein [Albitalea sp.]